jgi:hypothetical protein
MLEKTLAVMLVTKLSAIMLMEANFNLLNKIIYGTRIMAQARDHHLVSEKIYSKKGKMAEDGMLTKTLFYDSTCQAQVLAAIASVDASNC